MKLLAEAEAANVHNSAVPARFLGVQIDDRPLTRQLFRELGLPISTEMPLEVYDLMALYPQAMAALRRTCRAAASDGDWERTSVVSIQERQQLAQLRFVRAQFVGEAETRGTRYFVLASGEAVIARHCLPIAETLGEDYVAVAEKFDGVHTLPTYEYEYPELEA